MVERIEGTCFIGIVKQNIRNRSVARSARLKQEASNCIAIAIGKSDSFTADLIDEALRLNARARELSAPMMGIPVRETADPA